MIRVPMETQKQRVAVKDENFKSEYEKTTKNPSFRLEPWTGSQKKDLKIWTLVFDLQGEKVNKLNQKVTAEFEKLLSQLESMGSKEIDALVLLSGKPEIFIAGADIAMIKSVYTEEEAEALSRSGQKLLDRWEDLPFPTVAGVNGAALGGGCEFCLGSSAVVMSNDPVAKIGLPEVMLGIIPGMGGCVRLPRKVGLATALDMILTGKTLSGERAFKAGLVEACIPKENFDESVHRWAETNLSKLRSKKRIAKEPALGGMGGPVGTLLEKTPARFVIFKKAREGVLEKTKGQYPAPLEALDVIQSTGGSYGPRATGSAREKAMQREAQGFGKLAASPVAKNLISLFFLTEEVKKSKGIPTSSAAVAQAVECAAVLGAGVMGGGIAQLFADKNIHVRMKDLNNQSLAAGIQSASRVFKKQAQRKKINHRQLLQKLNYIAPTMDYEGFHRVELVVEAIVENLETKKKVFQELEGQVSSECIIASNTSSLSITTMQSVFKNPERFVGMHFFNPVHKMPLVEVIRGEKTSDEAVTTIFQLCKRLGKTPVVVKDSPGFLVNRLLAPYLNEAVYLLKDGVSIPELDQALLDFGMPMGPMELLDEVGIDTADKVAHILHDAFGDRFNPAAVNDRLLKQKRFGKKTGKGFYVYEGPKLTKSFDPAVYNILNIRPTRGKVSTEEIVERSLFGMINEAARCLDEKVVGTTSEVDLGMIMGTGFPPFRGGVLKYADSVGLKKIVERLKKYESKLGGRFTPSPALLARAENGEQFYKE